MALRGKTRKIHRNRSHRRSRTNTAVDAHNDGMMLPKYAGTMKGVHGWYCSMYEKLGWMILAKAKGNDYKVDAYKQSVENLIKTIKHLMSEYKDHNRKHDLKVILMYSEFLQKYAEEHL